MRAFDLNLASSPCIMCVQYHEGGTVGDIMRDLLNTVGMLSTEGGYHLLLFEYLHGTDIPHSTHDTLTGIISYHCTEHSPEYSKYPHDSHDNPPMVMNTPTVLTISPTFIIISSTLLNIPHGAQDISHGTQESSTLLNTLQGTEHVIRGDPGGPSSQMDKKDCTADPFTT